MTLRRFYTLPLILIALALPAWYILSLIAPFRCPDVSEVVEVSASLWNRPDAGKDVPEFNILPDHFPEIVRLFKGGKPDWNPKKWSVLGFVRIRTIHREIKIRLFWTTEPVGAFKVGGVYYRGTNDAEIISVIVSAFANLQTDDATQ